MENSEILLVILTCFSAIFFFALSLAWFTPLIIEANKEALFEKGFQDSSEPRGNLGILDWLLLAMECIPVFWVISLLQKWILKEDSLNVKGSVAAKEKWKSERSIRVSFYLSLVSLATFIVCIQC